MGTRFKTRITEMLGIDNPILCGGMQWVTKADFIAEICNGGGFGFITAETYEGPDELRRDLRRMRDLTDKPFGVNISMTPEIGNVKDRTLRFCDVVCEEGIKFVETAGRNPAPILPQLKEAGIKVIHKLTSVRHAVSVQKQGVDAVTLVGYGSGGHVGNENVASFILIPLAVSRLEIPVIAGGGVCDGKGFLGALAMGAEAVLMGTAFLMSQESPIHANVKERMIQAEANETALLMKSIMNPARCLKNKLADEVLAMEAQGTTLEEILTKVSGALGRIAYDVGDPDMAAIGCGQVVGLINEVKPVRKVIEDILVEADALLDRLNRMHA